MLLHFRGIMSYSDEYHLLNQINNICKNNPIRFELGATLLLKCEIIDDKSIGNELFPTKTCDFLHLFRIAQSRHIYKRKLSVVWESSSDKKRLVSRGSQSGDTHTK